MRGLEKAGRETRCGAIQIDPLYEDAMEMQIELERTTKTLHKRH